MFAAAMARAFAERCGKVTRSLLGAIVFASATCGAHAGNLNDLWWDPLEPGWGVNVIQQEDVLFVSLFVYGADGRSTWYFGPDTRRPWNSQDHSGPLYAATGPWFGGRFDPAAVAKVEVGEIHFTPDAGGSTAMLSYRVYDKTITRIVQRYTWRRIPIYPGPYLGTVQLYGTSIGSCAWGGGIDSPLPRTTSFEIFVTQADAPSGSIRIVNDNLDVAGTFVQVGSLFRVQLEGEASAAEPRLVPPGHYIGTMDPLVADGAFVHGYMWLTGDNGCTYGLAWAGHLNLVVQYL